MEPKSISAELSMFIRGKVSNGHQAEANKILAKVSRLEANTKTLERENFSLSAGLCVHANGCIGDEGGSMTCPITETRNAKFENRMEQINGVWIDLYQVHKFFFSASAGKVAIYFCGQGEEHRFSMPHNDFKKLETKILYWKSQ